MRRSFGSCRLLLVVRGLPPLLPRVCSKCGWVPVPADRLTRGASGLTAEVGWVPSWSWGGGPVSCSGSQFFVPFGPSIGPV